MKTKNRHIVIEETSNLFFGNSKKSPTISEEKIIPQKLKRILLTSVMLFISAILLACPVCEKNQPKGFENITHGQGPDGNIDYIIMFVAIIIVGFTLIMSIKYLVHPKEKNKNHIKNLVVNEQNFTD